MVHCRGSTNPLQPWLGPDFCADSAIQLAPTLLQQHGIPVYEYGPHEVKMAVTGYGRAAKDQVQRMVQMVLSMPELPRPDDAADALAVAICLAHARPLAA